MFGPIDRGAFLYRLSDPPVLKNVLCVILVDMSRGSQEYKCFHEYLD
jgi:hypothetical protein